jgi:hypothetical protein
MPGVALWKAMECDLSCTWDALLPLHEWVQALAPIVKLAELNFSLEEWVGDSNPQLHESTFKSKILALYKVFIGGFQAPPLRHLISNVETIKACKVA